MSERKPNADLAKMAHCYKSSELPSTKVVFDKRSNSSDSVGDIRRAIDSIRRQLRATVQGSLNGRAVSVNNAGFDLCVGIGINLGRAVSNALHFSRLSKAGS